MDERAGRHAVTDREIDARANGRRHRVLVYDLSFDGCMIEFREGSIEPDDLITLHFGPAASAAGRLLWRMGRNGGVRFSRPLPDATVSAFRVRTGGKPASVWPHDRFGRPISRSRRAQARRL